MNIEKELVDNYKKFALVRAKADYFQNNDSIPEYSIREIETRGIVILENSQEAESTIREWLKRGIEVFASDQEFDLKYPPITSDERIARSRIFWWESIPKEEWTNEIREYFENDTFWQEFRIKNNLKK